MKLQRVSKKSTPSFNQFFLIKSQTIKKNPTFATQMRGGVMLC